MTNLSTKFEVSSTAKLRRATQIVEIGGFLVVRSPKIIGNLIIRQTLEFNRDCASVLYRIRVISSYLSKDADF